MKKLFTIAILALSVSAFAQIPTNGLVGYWPFNGNANDESGNGNNGIVYSSGLTKDRFGELNSAYSFNGIDTYIELPSSALFNTDKFSVSIWVNIFYSSLQTMDVFIVNKGSSPQWRIYSQGVSLVGDTCALVNDIFTTSGRFINALPIKIGFWRNIIMTGDGQQLNTYLDGRLVDFTPYNGIINKSNDYFTIGARYFVSFAKDFFLGELDELRLYNRELSDAEITSIYNENLCYQTITVTDTLVINANLNGFNPVTYANTIKVYPNPTKDKITIDCDNNFSTLNGYTIKITNSLNQAVYTSKITQQSATIDLSTWTGKGIYFVHLIDGNGSTIDIKKIVLQ
jgi:hypothetical protein